jgi:hypothetical protein
MTVAEVRHARRRCASLVKTILAREIETLALTPKRKSGKREIGKARNGKLNSGASLDDGDVMNSSAGADLN